MKKLELFYPLKKFVITQGFAQNANDYYRTHNLIGHTGIDMVSFYNDNIMAAQDGLVYKIINRDNPDLSQFRAVFQIIETDTGTYELCYGHNNKTLAFPAAFANTGETLATEGNTGDVYVNGQPINKEERMNGSRAGTHVHFQLRKVQKTLIPNFDGKNQFLSAQSGEPYRDTKGYYYLIPLYDNGANGCIDPTPFFNGLSANIVNEVNALTLLIKKFLASWKR